MSSNDPDQIRQDIERTRADLSYDVNVLADETNPKNIAQRQKDKAVEGVKDTARNLKERIMGSDDQDQYRQGQYGERYGYASNDPSVAGQAGQKLGEAKDAVADAAQQAKYKAQQAPREVRQSVRGNPLAAGLIAFGLGSLIGGLIPASRYESRAADQLKEKAAPLVDEVKGMAQDAVESVKPAAQEAVESVKQTAVEAKDNVAGQAQAAKDNVTDQAQASKENVQAAHEADKQGF